MKNYFSFLIGQCGSCVFWLACLRSYRLQFFLILPHWVQFVRKSPQAPDSPCLDFFVFLDYKLFHRFYLSPQPLTLAPSRKHAEKCWVKCWTRFRRYLLIYEIIIWNYKFNNFIFPLELGVIRIQMYAIFKKLIFS